MKKLLLSVALLAALLPVVAQSPAKPPLRSGVYLTGADFEQDKLTLESDPQREDHRIKLNEFFNKSYITVRHHGETHRYQKKEIFGVRDGAGTDYRLADGLDYKVLSKGPILLYQTPQHTQAKGQPLPSPYFFSAGPDAPVQRLNLAGLQKAYAGNHTFLSALDVSFPNGTDLTAYDAHNAQYRINYLYQKSLLNASTP
ncbi:hypothetical protein ACFQ48_18730 [Hymenobacter caeli]|uniref:Uncharacterized protein n=1 Tax=Hymenobacter caeli TaxID=2735894 RepID=A0ABX2FUW9_9BACT|nr:hypothetical protein [Hymenobacter caeli]NRT20985.1 hypothetical protein [Hymenobacter caeli]